VGDEKSRFDSLDDEAKTSCLTEARKRLETLAPDDFTAMGTIVYAVAS
jgi:hypothetical protein